MTYRDPLHVSVVPIMGRARYVDRQRHCDRDRHHHAYYNRQNLFARTLGLLGGLLAVAGHAHLVYSVEIILFAASRAKRTWEYGYSDCWLSTTYKLTLTLTDPDLDSDPEPKAQISSMKRTCEANAA